MNSQFLLALISNLTSGRLVSNQAAREVIDGSEESDKHLTSSGSSPGSVGRETAGNMRKKAIME